MNLITTLRGPVLLCPQFADGDAEAEEATQLAQGPTRVEVAEQSQTLISHSRTQPPEPYAAGYDALPILRIYKPLAFTWMHV